MTIWHTNATQNGTDVNGLCLNPLPTFHRAKSGNTKDTGTVGLATMTTMEPNIWEMASVAQTWRRERVCRRIMPKPTPWTASRTPSHSHKETLIQGPAPPAHGTYRATEETPQSICTKVDESLESMMFERHLPDTNAVRRYQPRTWQGTTYESC